MLGKIYVIIGNSSLKSILSLFMPMLNNIKLIYFTLENEINFKPVQTSWIGVIVIIILFITNRFNKIELP